MKTDGCEAASSDDCNGQKAKQELSAPLPIDKEVEHLVLECGQVQIDTGQ